MIWDEPKAIIFENGIVLRNDHDDKCDTGMIKNGNFSIFFPTKINFTIKNTGVFSVKTREKVENHSALVRAHWTHPHDSNLK